MLAEIASRNLSSVAMPSALVPSVGISWRTGRGVIENGGKPGMKLGTFVHRGAEPSVGLLQQPRVGFVSELSVRELGHLLLQIRLGLLRTSALGRQLGLEIGAAAR